MSTSPCILKFCVWKKKEELEVWSWQVEKGEEIGNEDKRVEGDTFVLARFNSIVLSLDGEKYYWDLTWKEPFYEALW